MTLTLIYDIIYYIDLLAQFGAAWRNVGSV